MKYSANAALEAAVHPILRIEIDEIHISQLDRAVDHAFARAGYIPTCTSTVQE